ncbi:MAG TPA: hypothetical protein VJ793_01055 [Anaerolineae bacterium]|nr:hypothetical protein [Anaerolineae bacterium]
MSETFVVALIAFLGTLLTVWVGYQQWKRQHIVASRQAYQNDRQAVYKRLWELLPDSTTPLPSEGDLEKSLEGIQVFLQKNELHVDERDGVLIIKYLGDLLKLRQLVSEAESQYESERQPQIVLTPADVAKIPRGSKETFFQRWYWKLRREIDRLRWFSFEKFLSSPHSFWYVLTAMLMPSVASEWYGKALRQIYALSTSAGKSRKRLVYKIRSVLSGQQ